MLSPALGLGMGREAGSAFSGKLPVRTKVLQGNQWALLLGEGRKGVGASRAKAAYPVKTCPSVSRCLPAQGQRRHRQSKSRSSANAQCGPQELSVPPPSHCLSLSIPSLSHGSLTEAAPHHPTLVRSDALGSSPHSRVSANAVVCGRCCPQHTFLNFLVTTGMLVNRGRRRGLWEGL